MTRYFINDIIWYDRVFNTHYHPTHCILDVFFIRIIGSYKIKPSKIKLLCRLNFFPLTSFIRTVKKTGILSMARTFNDVNLHWLEFSITRTFNDSNFQYGSNFPITHCISNLIHIKKESVTCGHDLQCMAWSLNNFTMFV